MEISVIELDNIAKTLPIGYYAKRRIDVSVEENEETSYYIPTQDKVVISFNQIHETLSHMGELDDETREMAIRSNLYHEISHAILTPMEMRVTDIINVFEDERIETLLRNYYMNVDFKKMVRIMNGYNGEEPTNAFQAFYHCVRFRHYKPQFVARVDEIIRNHKDLNRFTDKYHGDGYYWGSDNIWEYTRDIENLYNDIAKDFASSSTSGGTTSSSGSGYSTDIMVDADGNPIGADGEPKENADAMSGTPMSDAEMGEFLSGLEIDELMGNAFSGFVDTSLESALKIILENFRKKNSKGSAINSYSGVLNPRQCGRDDYKFFEKAMTTNGTNTFGTLHLNLFIDKSGSFTYNEKIVNTLIKALSTIEKQNRNFTLDLVFCGCGEKLVTDKSKRFIECRGGNYLDDDIYDIFRKLQKPNTYNYNIVLFDGDAFTDAPYSERKSKTVGKTFSAFDKNNCTIISDRDNEKYISKYVSRARVIYTYDYANELIANVQTTLASAFR